MKAIWKNTVIAESDNVKVVENDHYFPMEDIKKEFFHESARQTRCIWKGQASYFHIEVKGDLNKDAAWYYPEASYAARPIENHVAFWKGIKIEK